MTAISETSGIMNGVGFLHDLTVVQGVVPHVTTIIALWYEKVTSTTHSRMIGCIGEWQKRPDRVVHVIVPPIRRDHLENAVIGFVVGVTIDEGVNFRHQMLTAV